MQRTRVFFSTVIQFVLLIDNTEQSRIAQAKTTIKTLGNTIKNSVGILRQNKNIIKNFACGFQEKYLKVRHSFGNSSLKTLGSEGIKKFKYTAPQARKGSNKLAIAAGKKNIQMRSVAYIRNKELGSLVDTVTKSKPQFSFLFVTGGLEQLTRRSLDPDLVPSPDEMAKQYEKQGLEPYDEYDEEKGLRPPKQTKEEWYYEQHNLPEAGTYKPFKMVDHGEQYEGSQRQKDDLKKKAEYAVPEWKTKKLIKADEDRTKTKKVVHCMNKELEDYKKAEAEKKSDNTKNKDAITQFNKPKKIKVDGKDKGDIEVKKSGGYGAKKSGGYGAKKDKGDIEVKKSGGYGAKKDKGDIEVKNSSGIENK